MAVATRAARTLARANGAPAALADGLGGAHVLEVQRARILSATVGVVVELGVGEASVAHVVERAGVSRRTFYELFADREECLFAALDDALARIAAVVVPAYGGQGAWHERIRAALVELLGLFDEDRGLARLVVVESLAAGSGALERRNRILAALTQAVDEGRAQPGAAAGTPVLTAEGVVGGVCAILHSRLSDVDREPLIGLAGALMGMIVLPYLGRAAASRELARPLPPARSGRRADSALVYPFRDLGMRLTYRTLRMLDAAASNPGASNRWLGEMAGISDQGQASKLLSRLERLGLLANQAAGHEKGAPNAWRLTDAGRSVVDAIAASSKDHAKAAAR